MNPWPVIRALFARQRNSALLFTALVALAVAIGVAITSQERVLREGSARAADKFDLIVAAPGSQTDLLMSIVYLRPTAVELMRASDVAKALGEERAALAAPIAFGDSFEGCTIIGTTAAFVDHLSAGLVDGRMFEASDEAVVGAAVPLAIGGRFEPVHGHGPEALLAEEEDHHGFEIEVVGRMAPTGTPWDDAIVVPVELVWEAHALPNGHALDDHLIGPLFDPSALPGVPAVVMTPSSVAAAYGLRSEYRTASTTAFFPAEVLVQLYDVLRDVGGIMLFLALAFQALVVAATLAGVLAIMELYRTELAVLRALGATRGYVFSVVWGYVTLFVLAGTLLGLVLGVLVVIGISTAFAADTGIALTVRLGQEELMLAAGLVAVGSAIAILPA
ncbi:MAG: FtsX-like permease family protein [Geminicoccaceae bacterium]